MERISLSSGKKILSLKWHQGFAAQTARSFWLLNGTNEVQFFKRRINSISEITISWTTQDQISFQPQNNGNKEISMFQASPQIVYPYYEIGTTSFPQYGEHIWRHRIRCRGQSLQIISQDPTGAIFFRNPGLKQPSAYGSQGTFPKTSEK